jgi:hypothetical protein
MCLVHESINVRTLLSEYFFGWTSTSLPQSSAVLMTFFELVQDDMNRRILPATAHHLLLYVGYQ